MSEHDEQAALIRWFDMQFPALRGRLFAIPNGGQRHVRVAQKLKAEGVRRGVPDLFLPIPAGQYGGLFVELKTAKGKPTPEQKNWLGFLSGQGYRAECCNGWMAAKNVIAEYLDWEMSE